MPLPSFAKIVEARLRISTAPGSALRSSIDRRHAAPPPVRELWVCELALAPMRASDVTAWQVWLESFNGRAGDVDINMTTALSPQPAATIALASPVAAYASEILIDVSGEGVPAGTLITLGTQDGTQQLVEVLEAAPLGAGRLVPVAPRVRVARAVSVPIAVGAAAIGRFRLASDTEGMPTLSIDRGLAALTLVERV